GAAAVGVQDNNWPGAEVEAVVPRVARSGAVTEVVERPGRRTGLVLVIAEGGVGARLVPAPGRVVAAHVGAERTIGERVVAEGEDGARDGVEDPRRQLVAVDTATRDVAGREQYGVGCRRHKSRRDHRGTAGAARVRDRERDGVDTGRHVG